MFSYKIYNSFGNELKIIWNNLLNRSLGHTIFQLYEINKIWFDSVGVAEKKLKLHVVVIFFNNEVVALSPTLIKKKYFFLKELVFIGAGAFDYHQLIICNQQQSNEAVLKYLFRTLRGLRHVDIISLNNVPLEYKNISNDYSRFIKVVNRSTALSTYLPSTYSVFLKALKSNIRGDTNRQIRRLEKLGSLEYTHIVDKFEYSKFVKKLIAFKRERYRKKLVKDLFNNSAYGVFLEKIHDLIVDGIAHASNLSLNGEVISCHLGFNYDNRYYYYMPSFGEGLWGKYSPSRVHLFKIIDECIERGISCFDFTIGEEGYKKYFVDSSIEVLCYSESLNLLGNVIVVVERLYHILKATLRKITFLRKIILKILNITTNK